MLRTSSDSGKSVGEVTLGDRIPFGEYVRSRGAWLLRSANALTGNRDDAEDLVQATLVNMSEPEVAAALGVSVGTVKSTVARAVAKLREDSELGTDSTP